MNESRKLPWSGIFDKMAFDGDDGPRVADLTKDQLRAVFQPIVELETGMVFAQEALVRCSVPQFSNPLILFERALKENACGRLGRMIREVAFDRAEGPLFVNIHPHELASRWLVRPDDPLFFHSREVFLEITESATFTHFDICMSILREVCSRSGAFLVIDDFGAGYSNLNRIIELEPRMVKLDRSLVGGLDKSPRRQILARNVVRMCHELDADVVAEGIEREEELAAVRDTGARYGQGFYFAGPAYTPPPIGVNPLEDM